MRETTRSGLTGSAVSTCQDDELTRTRAPQALTSRSGTPQRLHTSSHPASAHQRPQPRVQRLWRSTTECKPRVWDDFLFIRVSVWTLCRQKGNSLVTVSYIDILSRFPMSITYPDYMRACAGFSQMTRGAPDVFCAIDRVPKKWRLCWRRARQREEQGDQSRKNNKALIVALRQKMAVAERREAERT